MALKHRIIPLLLCENGNLVKGVNFSNDRKVGILLPAIKVYTKRGVDELMLVDIAATQNNTIFDVKLIKEVAFECFIPLTVGGGVKTIEHVKSLLMAGADKILINSAAYENPLFIRDVVTLFGSQCIVVGIDVRKNKVGEYECFSKCGSFSTGHLVEDWALKMEALGAGEISITSIDNDGTYVGYDISLVKKIVNLVKIPVIAGGGAGSSCHVSQVLSNAGASAAAIGSLFHFTHVTPREIKKECLSQSLPVRLV